MARHRPIVLTRPEELRAVSGLVAHRIVAVMERLRSATVAELAERTGTEAGSLYYHVRKLRNVGVLRETERRSTGGRDEVVYELAGSEVVIDSSRADAAFEEELARSVRTRLRAVERGVLAAMEDRATVKEGRKRDLSLHFHQARLTSRDRAELQRRIAELEEWLVERDDEGRGEFVQLTIAVHPLR